VDNRVYSVGQQAQISVENVRTDSPSEYQDVRSSSFESSVFNSITTGGQNIDGSSLAPSSATVSEVSTQGQVDVDVSLGLGTPGDDIEATKQATIFAGQTAKKYVEPEYFGDSKRPVERRWTVYDGLNKREYWYEVPDEYDKKYESMYGGEDLPDHDCRDRNKDFIKNHCDIDTPAIRDDDDPGVSKDAVSLQLVSDKKLDLAKRGGDVNRINGLSIEDAYPYPGVTKDDSGDNIIDRGDDASERYVLDKSSPTQVRRKVPSQLGSSEILTVFARVRPELGNSRFIVVSDSGKEGYTFDSSIGDALGPDYRTVKVNIRESQNSGSDNYVVTVFRSKGFDNPRFSEVKTYEVSGKPDAYGFEAADSGTSRYSRLHIDWFVESFR
jgi:hypothetical protein